LKKTDIREFMKRKRISDSRSVENNSDKRLRIEIQAAQTIVLETRKAKAFCERTFALHRQQPEKDKRNFDVAPPWKKFCVRPWVH